MPYGDGTGPYGTGPVGWRRGSCGVNPHHEWPIWRGLRTQLTRKEEMAYLRGEKQHVEEILKDINKRLSDLAK
jgi:hypothetical protein